MCDSVGLPEHKTTEIFSPDNVKVSYAPPFPKKAELGAGDAFLPYETGFLQSIFILTWRIPGRYRINRFARDSAPLAPDYHASR